MTKRKRLLFALIALFVPLFFLPAPALCASAATVSRAECVLEASSRRFLHVLNADERLPMASTTKIMTALVILEDCSLDECVTVPEEATRAGGSSVYLKAGEEISVRDLLYGLMLCSGNDCAVTLAVAHSKSVKEFAIAMNRRAILLGAEHTHFTNPHGLPDDDHYTTARDLALISACALENPTFRAIVSTKFYAPRGWQNKNKLLWKTEGAIGVKTGYTVKAGRCLVSAAERNGMSVVAVTLMSPQMFERSEELLENAFRTYSLVRLCGEEFDGYRVTEWSYPLSDAEREKIRIVKQMNDPLPEKAGEIAGVMEIYLENRLLFSQNLFMING